MTRRTATPRGGFTMIELLVVILIIAILASLLVVAIGRVQVAAKRTATIAEIAQIANAIAAFKAKMNVGYIPCGGSGPNNTFQLKSSYTGKEPEAIYLKQLFPQMLGCNGVAGQTTGLPDMNLDANQTLLFFLTGGSNVTSATNPYAGYSNNRTTPFAPVAKQDETRIGPFIDFSANKYVIGLASTGGSAAAASLVDPWGSPYAYFAYNPTVNTYNLLNLSKLPSQVVYDQPPSFTFNGTTVSPYYRDGRALNQKGFQIISAGDNGPDDSAPRGFGAGGNWLPQQGDYAEGGAGADDLSNFNSGPLVIQN